MSIINTASASVRTVAVEVKALTIGHKQVTIAVYNQIQYEDIISDDGMSLIGEPWGIVNYHNKECSHLEDDDHVHVIWTLDGKLKKSIVDSIPSSFHIDLWQRSGQSTKGWEAHKAIYKQLQEMTQLFIAV